MTPREQRILHAYGTWSVARMLTHPDEGISHAKSSRYGCSGFRPRFDNAGWWMQTTSAGIELRDGHAPVIKEAHEVLRWSTIKRYALGLPQDLRDQLHAADVACAQSQRDYPTWKASGRAQGCGPSPAVGPLTEAQALYDEEHQSWQLERYLPWLEESDRRAAARQVLLDEALPLATATPEPADLLELLEALGASA